MSNFKFAYVRFVDDGLTTVVPLNDIVSSKFNPESYNTKKVYRVKYEDGEEYYAHVVCLAETEEEARSGGQMKRIKIPSKRYTEYDSTDVEEQSTCKSISKNDNNNNIHQRKQQTKFSKPECENFNRILNSQNATAEIPEVNNEIFDLQKQIQKLQHENKEIKTINLKMQNEILDKLPEIFMKIQLLEEKSNVRTEAIEKDKISSLKIGTRKNDQIYFGRGIWIPNRCYDQALVRCPSNDSRLIKELTLCVFSIEELLSSSVTGAPCNKTKTPPKPPLNPSKLLALQDIVRFTFEEKKYEAEKINSLCKSVNVKVGEKIQDLLKPSKKKSRNIPEIADIHVDAEDATHRDEFEGSIEAVREEVMRAEEALGQE